MIVCALSCVLKVVMEVAGDGPAGTLRTGAGHDRTNEVTDRWILAVIDWVRHGCLSIDLSVHT